MLRASEQGTLHHGLSRGTGPADMLLLQRPSCHHRPGHLPHSEYWGVWGVVCVCMYVRVSMRVDPLRPSNGWITTYPLSVGLWTSLVLPWAQQLFVRWNQNSVLKAVGVRRDGQAGMVPGCGSHAWLNAGPSGPYPRAGIWGHTYWASSRFRGPCSSQLTAQSNHWLLPSRAAQVLSFGELLGAASMTQ